MKTMNGVIIGFGLTTAVIKTTKYFLTRRKRKKKELELELEKLNKIKQEINEAKANDPFKEECERLIKKAKRYTENDGAY